MVIAYIGVPVAQGADRKGVELAPDFFRREGVIEMMNDIAGCYDLGNVVSSVIAEEKYTSGVDVKYLNTVVDINNQLRDKVLSVIKQNYFPLVVGGDHSLGLGSCAAAAMSSDNIGIIWFDAHGDYNTEETSPSGNLHGMPLAAMMGWCKSSLQSVVKTRVAPKNIFWIGTRDLDAGEKELAERYNLNIFSAEDVKKRGIVSVMSDIEEMLEKNGINKVHLSIDIDGMDPSIVCGTGTRVDNGLNNSEFYTFIDRIFATRKVISTDFVEYNHLLDDNNHTTAKWCLEALHYLSLKIKEVDF